MFTNRTPNRISQTIFIVIAGAIGLAVCIDQSNPRQQTNPFVNQQAKNQASDPQIPLKPEPTAPRTLVIDAQLHRPESVIDDVPESRIRSIAKALMQKAPPQTSALPGFNPLPEASEAVDLPLTTEEEAGRLQFPSLHSDDPAALSIDDAQGMHSDEELLPLPSESVLVAFEEREENIVDRIESFIKSIVKIPEDLPAVDAETTEPSIGDRREPDPTVRRKHRAKAELVTQKKGTHENPAVLAAQPQLGDHFNHQEPVIDQQAVRLPYEELDFSENRIYEHCPPDPLSDMNVYQGKHLNCNQRPAIEWGRPFYDFGQYAPSSTLLGKTNLLTPQFLAYGDFRSAIASNIVNGDHRTQIAKRLNLDLDLKLTATERIHAFVRPLDDGVNFSRVELDSGNVEFFSEFDFDFDTGFFEGDLGSIVGGMTGDVMPFDLPFAVGQIPLLLQNGLWMEDAFLGVAATIPARNSRLFDISNMDTTFFYGFGNITSPVFQGDDNAAKMYGATSFIEAMDGYFELGYTYLEDRTAIDRSYHNIGVAFTRRYGRLSNSIRVFVGGGQDPNGTDANANGTLLLVENSFVSRKPYTVVPYFNLFAGFGHPQSVARAGGTGGILKNTGINFETDGLTNYPTLDDSGAEAFGGALGMNMLADNLSHQLILEFAFLQTMGVDPLRSAVDDQYAVGARYQRPISNSVIFRADTMYGFFKDDRDVMGARMELRKKF